MTWLAVWPLPLVLVLIGVALMTFPDGRLPSPRWRVVVVAMVVAGTFLAVLSALWPVEYADNALAVGHPLDLGGAAAAQEVWNGFGPTAYLLFQIAWVACVIGRLRGARGRRGSPAPVVRLRRLARRGRHGRSASPSCAPRSSACWRCRSSPWRRGWRS